MQVTSIVSKDFVGIPDDTSLSETIGRLKQGLEAIIIFHGENYSGVIDKKKLLKLGMDASESKIKNFTQKLPLIATEENLTTVARLLAENNADFVPVEQDGRIIGVVRGIALAQLSLEFPEVQTWKVKDLELIRPTSVDKEDTIALAIRIMMDEKVDHIPLFEGNEIYGILSYNDFVRKYLSSAPQREHSVKFSKMSSSRGAEADVPKITSLPVSSFSTNDNLLTITEDRPIREALALMMKRQVADILVMNGNKFKGLLLLKTILHKISGLEASSQGLIQYMGLQDIHWESTKKDDFMKIVLHEAEKLQHNLRQECSFVVHIKEFSKTGNEKRHKYSVHVRMERKEFPGHLITTEQDDWDVIVALRKTFSSLENSLKKKFHTDTSRKKY